jgi:phospholipase/carboxylesterase
LKTRVSLFLLVLVFFAHCATGQKAVVENDLSLKYVVQPTSGSTDKSPLVILLHGYGGDEQNLFQLRRYFPENFIIVAARAPQSVPGAGYRWFERDISIRQYTGRKEDLEQSRRLVVKFTSEVVKKYHADPSRVYVMGFSQGAIMSYEAGLTAPKLYRGIGVLSGLMPASLKPLIAKPDALSQLRIFVAHGTADGVLPFSDGKAAVDHLIGMGLKPEFHSYKDMGHNISADVVTDLVKWLQTSSK